MEYSVYSGILGDPQGRVGTRYPHHSSRSNRNTEFVTKRMRVDAHFKGNITLTQCFESGMIEQNRESVNKRKSPRRRNVWIKN